MTHETTEIDVVTAKAPPRLFLEVQDGGRTRRVPLEDRPMTVGSASGVDIRIDDPTVSAQQCTIALEDKGVHVADTGSKNGTFIGGARVRDGWGAPGAVIVAGRVTIVCAAASGDEEADVVTGAPLPGIAGASSAMLRVARQVRWLANHAAPVLVTGETGVGKELVARALHREGARSEAEFVALNVAALPRELVESELFGHERGAFTGATARRDGAFVEAEGGTLFLDEIGELPSDAQPKLLRALDGYEVRRVGGAGSGKRTDVRVVAATHVPLLEHVRAGRFRRDLFHRLEVFVVEIPPLRARPGDILPIASTILQQLEPQIGERDLTPGASALLTAHEWPGNVRELRNVLLRAAGLSNESRWIHAQAITRAMAPRAGPKVLGFTPDRARDWLASHAGNVSAAARAAKMPRTTFRKLLARTG
ncbi:MAG: sigma 54-interacting transcriptional regulator [Labilithrix sp.]|nr:sigma 54-interacting transcriptional regulator [Labilithrix sp.]MCW5813011.1 sigma 54-interacting transcriptional regulator [Labilithrix sp.]